MGIKRISAALTAAVMFCSLTACNLANNDEKNSEKESVTEATVEESGVTGVPVDEDKVEFTIDSEELVKELEEEFAERHGNESVEDKRGDFIIVDDTVISYTGVEPHVVIPKGVKAIGDRAFWSNEFIESVEIPGSVKVIGAGAFWSCSALEYVNMESGVETIADTAFWSCPSLTAVNIPKSVNAIGGSAFHACSSSLTLHTPTGAYAEQYAASNGLNCVNDPAEYSPTDKSSEIRAAQYEYGEFEEFVIEEGITKIGATAFQYCEKLKSIDIPSSVEVIGADAFEYCFALEKVNINEGCKEIADGAFEYCESLADIYIPASVEQIGDGALDYCADSLVVHTPKGSYAEKYAIANKIAYDNNMN